VGSLASQFLLVAHAVAQNILSMPRGSAAGALTTRQLPDLAGTLPSRNSSARITSCAAHGASTG